MLTEEEVAEAREWFAENGWKTNKIDMAAKGFKHEIEGWEWFCTKRDVDEYFTTPGKWTEEVPVTEEMYAYMAQQKHQQEEQERPRAKAAAKQTTEASAQ